MRSSVSASAWFRKTIATVVAAAARTIIRAPRRCSSRPATVRACTSARTARPTTQVFDISELGLVEMTRKRVSEGLVESLSTVCTVCGGRGIVLDESLL